jgi:AcrR family transcriptional regulator
MQDAMARERQDLLAAFTRMAAEEGYRAVTVEAVTSAANLPRERFEAHFASIEEALGAAQEQFLERMRQEAESSCAAEARWPERVRAGLGTVLGRVVETEGLSRALMVEAPGVDFAAGQRQLETLERFAAMLEEGRRFYPGADGLPRLAERTIVGGVASIVTECVLGEETVRLRVLESELLQFLLTPYLGPEGARRFAEA